MNSTLEQALTGPEVRVTLGGTEYPLAYPMQAVILYQQETAALDQRRAKDRPKLTQDEKLQLAMRRRSLRKQMRTLPDTDQVKFADWPEDEQVRFEELQTEGTEI